MLSIHSHIPYYLMDCLTVLYEISNIISSNDEKEYKQHQTFVAVNIQKLKDVLEITINYGHNSSEILLKYALIVVSWFLYYQSQGISPPEHMKELTSYLQSLNAITKDNKTFLFPIFNIRITLDFANFDNYVESLACPITTTS